jgi:hypothetical protein
MGHAMIQTWSNLVAVTLLVLGMKLKLTQGILGAFFFKSSKSELIGMLLPCIRKRQNVKH